MLAGTPRVREAPDSTSGTVTGTGASPQVAVWNAASVLTGYAVFTFDGTTLSVGTPGTITVNGSPVTSRIQANSDILSVIENRTHSAVGASGALYYAARSRGTAAAPTIVSSGDFLGGMYFVGYDGTDYATSAAIIAVVDGTPGSNDMPGSIIFMTSPDGSQTLATRMSINKDGTTNFKPGADVNAISMDSTNIVGANVLKWNNNTGITTGHAQYGEGFDGLTFGGFVNFKSNSANADNRSLVYYENINAASVGTYVQYLIQRSTNYTQLLHKYNEGVNQFLIVEVNNANAVIGQQLSMQQLGSGSITGHDFLNVTGSGNNIVTRVGTGWTYAQYFNSGKIHWTIGGDATGDTYFREAATGDMKNLAIGPTGAVKHVASGIPAWTVVLKDASGVISFDFQNRTAYDAAGAAAWSWDSSGLFLVGTVRQYKNISTLAGGVPSLVGQIALTGQTAALGATTLYAIPSTGQGLYRIIMNAKLTTPSTATSSLGGGVGTGFQVIYTDKDDSVVVTTGPITNIAPTNASSNTTQAIYSAQFIGNFKKSTNIDVTFGYNSVGAVPMAYSINVIAEAIY